MPQEARNLKFLDLDQGGDHVLDPGVLGNIPLTVSCIIGAEEKPDTSWSLLALPPETRVVIPFCHGGSFLSVLTLLIHMEKLRVLCPPSSDFLNVPRGECLFK